MGGTGRLLIITGIIIVAAGIIFAVGEKYGLCRLPGDIFFKKGNFSFRFPVVSSIIISIILTVILNIFFRK